MVDFSAVTNALPGWQLVIFFVILFMFLVTGGVITFVILYKLRWKTKVVILEDPSGRGSYQVVGRDRARLIKFGDGGEEIYYLKNRKKYRAAYGKKIGHNQIAWAVGNDGYWYNITFANLDKKLMEIGISPIDRDIRLANSSIRKGIETRYDPTSGLQKWMPIIMIGSFILIVAVLAGFLWFAFDQQAKVAASNAETMKTSKEVINLAKDVLSSVANIKGGSGIYSG